MAFEHGKGGYFSYDNDAGTLFVMTAFIENLDFPRDIDVPETTVFSQNDRTYIAGLRGSTISISGFWDGASSQVDEVIELIITGSNSSATKSFEYGPQGNSTGAVKYSGESFVTGYSISHPVDGVVSFTLDIQITAAVTRGTFA